jgi:hypothetical protein
MNRFISLLTILLASNVNAGSFQKIKEIPNNDPSLYGPGCTQPGQYSSKRQFDQRLKAGSRHEYVTQQVTSNGNLKSAKHAVDTTSINQTQTKIGYTLLGVQGIPYNGPTQGSAECWFPNPAVTQCQFIPASTNEFAMLVWGNAYIWGAEYCKVNSYSNSKKKTEFGKYTFADGRVVDAFKIEWSNDSVITCLDGYQGNAKEFYWEIVSNDVPARPENTDFCGGVKLVIGKSIFVGTSPKFVRTTEMVTQR